MRVKLPVQVPAATLTILFLFASSFLIPGCQEKNEYAAPPPPAVTVSRPLQKTVTDYAEFTGMTEAFEVVEVRARVEGYLESIRFRSGSRVKEGDLLFIIDPKPFQARLDEAQAELESRQAALKQAEATLKRKDAALKANAVSEIDVIQARADRDMARAAIQAARATIDTARLNLSYTRIHAPISGRIGRNLVDVGNLVGAGERTLLTTIVNDDPIYAYFNVSERDLLYYQSHYSYEASPWRGGGEGPLYLGLSTQEGYPYEGMIDYVDNRIDPSTGTIQVRGVFANPDGTLWPGLFARIRVPIGTRENALLVPDTSLGTDQRGSYLLIVNDENIVDLRPVQTGPLVDEMRVIEKGLSPDDQVVIKGLQRARPGIAVTPVPAQEASADSTEVATEPKR